MRISQSFPRWIPDTMKKISNLFSSLGEYVIFISAVFISLRFAHKRRYHIIKQMKNTGYDSVLLIFITSAFTGLVTAVQTYYQTSGYISKNMIGILIEKTTLTELAPALTALVLCGRIGASIAAEIGTMKISEQIDALETMAVDPIDYLYMPKVFAGAIMVPLLTIFADAVSIFSAFFLCKFKYDLTIYVFFYNMRNFFEPSDLWGGLIKAFFFGIIITSIGCFCGSKTEGGAEGVGVMATNAVVYSSISILIMDFVVASILFGKV